MIKLLIVGKSSDLAHTAQNHKTLLRYATRRKLGTRRCKARASHQIASLFERAA
jgi:hypothetical protein